MTVPDDKKTWVNKRHPFDLNLMKKILFTIATEVIYLGQLKCYMTHDIEVIFSRYSGIKMVIIHINQYICICI